LSCAVRHRPLLHRSLAVAAIVGTVLVALNQGDVLLSAQWPPSLAWKIPLTYAVPFVVATWGALVNARVGAAPVSSWRGSEDRADDAP
jgi:hypothetical protein